jgi:hypothetical protein
MARHQCIPLDSPSEWRAALQGIKHGFSCTWEHCYAMHLTTGLTTLLYCFETEGVRIVCPIVEREFEGYLDIAKPFGYSGFVGTGDCPEFSHHWKEFTRQRGYVCGYLGVDPIFDNSTYFEQAQVYQHNSVYVLDLTPSYEELFANLRPDRRQRLRKWDKITSSLVTEKSRNAEFFLANYHSFMREKNAPSFYYLSTETLSFLISLDNIFMVGARGPEELVAVALFTYTPYVGDWLFTISRPEGRHHSTSLVWYGVKYLKSLQIPYLNLGGTSHEDDGMAQFKERFGSQKTPLKSLKQVYEPEVYEMLCRQANVDPGDMTGYFPAYRGH